MILQLALVHSVLLSYRSHNFTSLSIALSDYLVRFDVVHIIRTGVCR